MNEKLTAYALNELPPDERAALEAQMKDDPKLREEADEMKAFCEMLESEVRAGSEDTLAPEQRSKLVQTFQTTETKVTRPPFWRRPVFFNGLGLAAAACVALMFAWREVKEASLTRPEKQQVKTALASPQPAVTVKSDAVEVPPLATPAPKPTPSEQVTVLQSRPVVQAQKAEKRLTKALSSTADSMPAAPPVALAVPPSLPTPPPPALATASTFALPEPHSSLYLGSTSLNNGAITFQSLPSLATDGAISPANTLTLSGANAYTGSTSVNAGSLATTSASGFNGGGQRFFYGYQNSSDTFGSLDVSGQTSFLNYNETGFDINGNGFSTATPVLPGPLVANASGSTSASTLTFDGGVTVAGSLSSAPSQAEPALTPDHVKNVDDVARRLQKAQSYKSAARDQLRSKMLNQANNGKPGQAGAAPATATEPSTPNPAALGGNALAMTEAKESPQTRGAIGDPDAVAPKAAKKAEPPSVDATPAAPWNLSKENFSDLNEPKIAAPSTPSNPSTDTLHTNSTTLSGGTATAGPRAGKDAISPDSVAGLVKGNTIVATNDAVQKDVAREHDELAKQAVELKKEAEEMSRHSYELSVQEAQRRVLEEKLLRDRLNTERVQRQRDQYVVEQRSRYNSGTATYRPIVENQFSFTSQEPLSTFSTDVDTASYANARRFLNAGERPPPDAVRLEELVNYFPYAYAAPEGDHPLSVKVDIGEAPWQPLHRLARIAIKAREVKNTERPAANFTFLLDVSGSMSPAERLPLVKKALRLLVDQLREDDRVSIVTYAGESGLALESTAGNEKEKILEAINRLNAEGSTNGASGIRMAYEQAVSHYKKNGVNRVILCTDGDFNVGTSNVEELKTLIAEKAKTGVFLSVLGVGTDNLHDFTMQTLADCGNGNYHYLDSMSEARKVLVEQMTSNMITVAKDVKIQVEFNPAQVAAYRLIGYEKRLLEKEDFNNDKKDAGDIGAGHTITALYEIVPADLKYPDGKPLVDDLKYNQPATPPADEAGKAEAPAANKETMTVKLRYKEPNQDKSKLMSVPVTDAQKKLSENDRDFQFATSVAGFGMLLRGSPYGNELSWDTVRQLALSGKGEDEQGWRGEFIQLIEKARGICER